MEINEDKIQEIMSRIGNDSQHSVDATRKNAPLPSGRQAMKHIEYALRAGQWDQWLAAQQQYNQALDIINQLENNAKHQYAKALTLNNLAYADLNYDELQTAHQHIKEAIEILNQLPSDPENLRERAYLNLAMIEEKINAGQPDKATMAEIIFNESQNLNERDDNTTKPYTTRKSPKKDDTKTLIVILAIIIILIAIALIFCFK